MAFQYRKYIGFHEGLDDSSDPRDISPNALADVNNMAVDRIGRLRTLGGFVASAVLGSYSYSGNAYELQAGMGFFCGYSDYNFASPPVAATTKFGLLAVENTGTGKVELLKYSPAAWQHWQTMGDGDGKVVFSFVNNTIYMTVWDENYIRDTQQMRLFDYEWFTNSGTAISSSGWLYTSSRDLVAPATGVVSDLLKGTADTANSTDTRCYRDTDAFDANWVANDFGTGVGNSRARVNVPSISKVKYGTYVPGSQWFSTDALGDGDVYDGKDFRVYTGSTDTCGFMVNLAASSVDGTWTATDYEFGQTFIFTDGSETEIMTNDSSKFTPTADKAIDVEVHAGVGYPDYVKGGRIYYREDGSDGEWKLLCEIDLSQGVRATPYSSYAGWNKETNTTLFYTDVLAVVDPSAITYEALNGYPQTTQNLEVYAQQVALCSNRIFYGRIAENVGVPPFPYTSAKWVGDRILYSPPGKFDAVPQTNYYDIATGDGDYIRALVGFRDRLLVFKTRTLYVLNMSGGSPETWFIEGTYTNMGVERPTHTFSSGSGIVWVNEHGCFFYDGETIENLTLRGWVTSGTSPATPTGLGPQPSQGRSPTPNITGEKRNLEIGTWSDFIQGSATVGIDPVTGKIIILGKTTGTTNDPNLYVYDRVTKSWVRGDGPGLNESNYRYSNFASLEGKLVIMRDDYDSDSYADYEWTDTMQSQDQYAVLVDDVFDDEVHYKRIYSVTLTYRGSANINMDDLLHYATDGSGSFVNTYVPSTQVALSTAWKAVEIEFTQPLEVQSLQLKLLRPSGTMEINDITVKYRTIHKTVS